MPIVSIDEFGPGLPAMSVQIGQESHEGEMVIGIGSNLTLIDLY